jgi:hypothetical protein
MKRIVLLVVGIGAGSVSAYAQDAPKVGMTMGYPGSIGVIWRIADRIALRPEMSLTHATGDSTGGDLVGATPLSTDETTGIGTGISALFYMGRWDALRTYASPRFVYSRSSTSASSGGTIAGPSTSESTVSSYTLAGSFGAQYTLGRRFGLFGEVGLSYGRTSTSLSSTFTTSFTSIVNGVVTQATRIQALQSGSHSNALATRSGAGVIFFF